jgi:hypothetical protein
VRRLVRPGRTSHPDPAPRITNPPTPDRAATETGTTGPGIAGSTGAARAVHAVPAALAALVMLPLLRPGYVLSYDMVFVPRQPFTPAMFGLGGTLARAVPSDFAVALAARVLPGDVVQKLVLAGILLAAGYGILRLLRGSPPLARACAATLYVWNPFVYERLVLGHWALLLGYAALPWAVHGALGMRMGDGAAATRKTGIALGVAAVGGFSAGAIVAAVVLLVVAWPAPPPRPGHPAPAPRQRQRLRQGGLVLGATLVLNAPWLVPSLLRPSGVSSDPIGVGAFAAGADSALGTLGSLLTLGGTWNADVAPPGRASLAVAAASLALVAVAAAGLTPFRDRMGRAAVAALVAAAGSGLLVAAAPHLPVLRTLVSYAVVHLPGGGILRDSQKYVLPLVLLTALAFGLGAARLVGAAHGRRLRRAAAALALLAPLAVLPALALGAWGRLSPVAYPDEWARARAAVTADPVPGAVVVLPWRLYRAFPWNDGRPTLDPAPRFFDRAVVVNDDLQLADRTVRGEDPWARRLDPLMGGGGPLPAALAGHDVRYVLVELTEPGAAAAEQRLAGAEVVLRGADLALYRLTDPSGTPPPAAPAPPVVLGDVAAATLFLGLLLVPYRVGSTRLTRQ